MIRQRIIAITFASLLGAQASQAAFNNTFAGTSAGEFLKLGADARGMAMGEAMTAVANDATAIYWNPAGLSQLRTQHLSFTHAQIFQSMFYDFAVYARPVKPVVQPRRRFLRPSGLGTLALAAFYLNAGELTERDKFGFETGGKFTPRDLAIMAGWGATLTENFDFGIGFKFIESRILNNARTGAIDTGARLRLHIGDWPYTIAFAARNLGGTLRFRDQRDPLPVSFRLGQSLQPHRQWIIGFDIVKPRDNDLYFNVGSELNIDVGEELTGTVRGGWSGRTSSTDLDGTTGISFGGGVTLRTLSVDYAWLPFGLLGQTHRFSVSLRW